MRPGDWIKEHRKGLGVAVVVLIVLFVLMRRAKAKAAAAQATAPGLLSAGGSLPLGPSGNMATGPAAVLGALGGPPAASSPGAPPSPAYSGPYSGGAPTPTVGPLAPAGYSPPFGSYNSSPLIVASPPSSTSAVSTYLHG